EKSTLAYLAKITSRKKEQKMEGKLNKKMIFFFGALGGLLYGYDMGVISGALFYIKTDIPLSDCTEGLVVSSMLIRSMFGSGCSGPLSSSFSRRRLVVICVYVFVCA